MSASGFSSLRWSWPRRPREAVAPIAWLFYGARTPSCPCTERRFATWPGSSWRRRRRRKLSDGILLDTLAEGAEDEALMRACEDRLGRICRGLPPGSPRALWIGRHVSWLGLSPPWLPAYLPAELPEEPLAGDEPAGS